MSGGDDLQGGILDEYGAILNKECAPLYPSYFKPHARWLPSLTPVTYLSKLLGIRAVAACLQLEFFRV
ncbi:hypothetical protein BV921_04735 [Pectobacterium odoriferum]|nr:hypothetical protein BV925_14165 [Pectobacterium odoriferum]POE02407.1 hypothetical protein BVY05_06210 [Pectobacterium odoriferum]POE05499.1 hypothetical protein BV916_08430 [Pectobacterium odoriferum]POE11683.1 hypothetical protein BV921_04735 [Pectobacterium odoriferum]POE24109.1 hypothetical protein BV923_04810 [Pectobacterium odoriferum]